MLDIQEDLRQAAGLVNGLRVAVEQTRKGERDQKGDSETVFSVELKIEGGEERE